MRNCIDPAMLARGARLEDGHIDWMLLETDFWPGPGPGPGDDEHARPSTIVISCVFAEPVGVAFAPMGDEWFGLSCRYGRGPANSERPWAGSQVDFAIVYARNARGLAAQDVNGLIARMKAEGVGHVLVVSPDAVTRRALTQADSWIVGSVRTGAATAGIVADALQNVVNAPATINCGSVRPGAADRLSGCASRDRRGASPLG